MTRSRTTVALLSGLLMLPLAALPTTIASGAPASCATAGPDANVWQRGNGDWSDYTHWSLRVVPAASSGQSVCIPDGVEVMFGEPLVDLQRFELGRDSRLIMQPDSALYVWGEDDQESLTRLDSFIEVNGATLGGPGDLHVNGTVQLAKVKEWEARLTSGDSGGAGELVVGDDGTLDFTGSDGNVRLTGGYTVVVHGRARLLDDAGLVADAGTRFELRAHLADDGEVGRFVIRNDRGYFAPEGTENLSEFVNEGKIVKWESPEESAVTANYTGTGDVRVRKGYLVVPEEVEAEVEVAPGAAVGSGLCIESADRTCVTQTTEEETQFASLAVPDGTDGFAKVDITVLEDADVPAQAVGKPMLVHAQGVTATRADPVEMELRYDGLLLDKNLGLDKLQVARLDADGEWDDIFDCIGSALPPGEYACLDRRKGETRRDHGDVILVVLTKRTSRWISRWIPH